MKRMMLRVTGLMVLFGALSVATAHADSRFSVHVGVGAPPVVVAPGPYGYGAYVQAPYPGYVWQPGYYVGSPLGGGRVGAARDGTSSGAGIDATGVATTSATAGTGSMIAANWERGRRR